MTRRLLVGMLSIVLLLGSFGSSGIAQTSGPPAVTDNLRAFTIFPPGEEGEVSTTEFAAGSFGAHYDDQLEMYASLVNDDDVDESELGKYFHSMQFGPEGEADEPYTPTTGATVYRDSMGIPHIYADSLEHGSFALGYVAAEDRLFQMDVFRHAARGTLSEFVGPSYLQMDIDTRREGYTEEEIKAMFDNFDDKFGEVGATVQTGLQAYTDGVNAYMDEARSDPMRCSFEYQATANPCPEFPHAWTVEDTLFLVVLQLRVFGETAGGEFTNAAFYAHLVDKLGAKLGRKVYDDFVFQNDPKSPITIPADQKVFHTQDLGKLKKSSIAIPDKAEEMASRVAAREESRRRILAGMGFRSPASNALLVSAKESASGNPLEIGAPQVGYAVPSFFYDIDLHISGDDPVDFRGPAVPGASALIPLGRGRDYAWSLTTGYSDAVDTRAEKLCDPKGGEATIDSTGYMFDGECKEMESRTETFTLHPTPTDPGQPGEEERTFYRTIHGPVFARGKVNGEPVAFVKERFFWMRELDSIPSFYRWNSDVHSVQDFKAAAKTFTMSFNSFYADAEDIGYFHVGFYPKRTPGVSPSLPTWGTGEWEWQGRLPFKLQPQVINPKQGWLANWNNKPSLGWDNYDSLKWGSIQRMQLLADGMKKITAGKKKAELSDIVDVIRDAATRDTRGVYLGPKMLKWAKADAPDGNKKVAQALEIVSKWVSEGARRRNADADDNMDDGPALAIFDKWYDELVHRVFDDEIGPEGYDLIAAPITDYTPEGGSSFWFDFSSYLKNLFGKKTNAELALDYCDNRSSNATETCRKLVLSTLIDALDKLAKEQDEPDMTKWTKPAENIVFQELGAGSVDPIPWQNRGTHNHVVEILKDAG